MEVVDVREVQIAQATRRAIGFAIFGFFCFGVVLGPLAIYYAREALADIALYQLGGKHRTPAIVALCVGAWTTVQWLLLTGWWVSS